MDFNFSEQIKQKSNEELNEIFINAKDYHPEFVQLAEEEMMFRAMPIDKAKQIKAVNNNLSEKQLAC